MKKQSGQEIALGCFSGLVVAVVTAYLDALILVATLAHVVPGSVELGPAQGFVLAMGIRVANSGAESQKARDDESVLAVVARMALQWAFIRGLFGLVVYVYLATR